MPLPPDRFRLQRFIDAQDACFEQVAEELRDGLKRTHWMWFIFPQMAGLGSSAMAKRYAIANRAEADAYLRHEVFGVRLKHCTKLVNRVSGRTIEEIFGYPDNLKFHSSMTLFHAVCPGEGFFKAALTQYFGGRPDAATLALL